MLEILETLNEDEIDSLTTELSEIGGLSSKLEQTIDSPKGKGILITYVDNGISLITVTNIDGIDCIFVGHYDADRNIEHSYGISWQEMIDDFKNVVQSYFDFEIE
ncbi:hypothetical protein RJI07_08615 [Mycoplasmatota bacterium WC30]